MPNFTAVFSHVFVSYNGTLRQAKPDGGVRFAGTSSQWNGAVQLHWTTEGMPREAVRDFTRLRRLGRRWKEVPRGTIAAHLRPRRPPLHRRDTCAARRLANATTIIRRYLVDSFPGSAEKGQLPSVWLILFFFFISVGESGNSNAWIVHNMHYRKSFSGFVSRFSTSLVSCCWLSVLRCDSFDFSGYHFIKSLSFWFKRCAPFCICYFLRREHNVEITEWKMIASSAEYLLEIQI